jgi:putative ABC transport system substrate-binding protein
VIFGISTPVIAALLQQTRSIPIVFAAVGDPTGNGFVDSFAHPGGNVTGFTNFEPTIGGKWVQLLKEIAPKVTRIALIFNPGTAGGGVRGGNYLSSVEAAGPQLGIELVASPVHDDTELDRAIESMAFKAGGGLIVNPDVFTTVHRERIIGLAAQYRLPAIFPYRQFVTGGGLMSFGIDLNDLCRRSGSYSARILRGEMPSDLPVQLPTKFELVINLKTAKALGLTIPETLLATADEVIQ